MKHYIGLCLLLTLLVTQTLACPNNVECYCEQDQNQRLIVNCRGQGHPEVPTFVPESTLYYEVTLANNRIGNIPASAFAGLNVERIDLSQNNIASVDSNAFLGVEDQLQELLLEVNGMTSVPSTVGTLTKLKILHLEGFVMSTLATNLLQPFTQLEELYLVNDGIQFMYESDFQLGNVIKVLDVQNNDLDSVPNGALGRLTNLQKLLMNHNQIDGIEANAFVNNVNLLELDMSNNQIDQMNINAFQGLANVHFLGLQSNKISTNAVSALKNLRGLEQLNLGYNKLTRIPNIFSNMQGLGFLNLQHNEITYISEDNFDGIKHSLGTLLLNGNKMTGMARDTFLQFTALRELHLNEQPMLQIGTDTFVGLENSLTTLYLTNTSFSSSGWLSVTHLRSLQMLFLSANNIDVIPDNTFSQTKLIKSLDLSKNTRISTLTPRTFNGLQGSVENIDLGNNNIATMDKCVLFKFDAMRSMSLRNNPLHCDCKLQWLRDWLDDKYPGFLILTVDWTCASPSQHANTLFRDLSVNELTCQVAPPATACEDLTITTTKTTPSSPTTTPGGGVPPIPTTPIPPRPLLVNVTDVTGTSATIHWVVLSNHNIASFMIEYTDQQTNNNKQVPGQDRNTKLVDLKKNTEYTTCVTLLADVGGGDIQEKERGCSNFRTTSEGSVAPITDPPNNTAIILGAVFGVLLLVVIILAVVFFIRRNKGEKAKSKPDSPVHMRPQSGQATQRFSKPKKELDSMVTKDLDKYTPEERDRILRMMSQSKSTVSVISTTSSGAPRYVPDPMGNMNNPRLSADGYLNPALLNSNEEFYHEIPDGRDAGEEYYEIDEQNPPVDKYYEIQDQNPKSASKYDNVKPNKGYDNSGFHSGATGYDHLGDAPKSRANKTVGYDSPIPIDEMGKSNGAGPKRNTYI